MDLSRAVPVATWGSGHRLAGDWPSCDNPVRGSAVQRPSAQADPQTPISSLTASTTSQWSSSDTMLRDRVGRGTPALTKLFVSSPLRPIIHRAWPSDPETPPMFACASARVTHRRLTGSPPQSTVFSQRPSLGLDHRASPVSGIQSPYSRMIPSDDGHSCEVLSRPSRGTSQQSTQQERVAMCESNAQEKSSDFHVTVLGPPNRRTTQAAHPQWLPTTRVNRPQIAESLSRGNRCATVCRQTVPSGIA